MRFAVETWAPEYGAPVGDEALGDSDAPVDVGVEADPGDWAPRPAPAAPAMWRRAPRGPSTTSRSWPPPAAAATRPSRSPRAWPSARPTASTPGVATTLWAS